MNERTVEGATPAARAIAREDVARTPDFTSMRSLSTRASDHGSDMALALDELKEGVARHEKSPARLIRL